MFLTSSKEQQRLLWKQEMAEEIPGGHTGEIEGLRSATDRALVEETRVEFHDRLAKHSEASATSCGYRVLRGNRERTMQRFLGLAVVMLVVKIADLLTTWLYTPDFSLTVNPFRQLLPLWGFLGYQAVALAVVWFGMYLHLTKPIARFEQARSVREYWSLALYGRDLRTGEWFTATPAHGLPLGQLLGFLGVFVAIPAGNLSIISNVLCLTNGAYLAFYQEVGQLILNTLFVVGTVVATVVYVNMAASAGRKTA